MGISVLVLNVALKKFLNIVQDSHQKLSRESKANKNGCLRLHSNVTFEHLSFT